MANMTIALLLERHHVKSFMLKLQWRSALTFPTFAVGPSWYWASIGQNLWEHNIFRAIENGFTVIKCSENEISGAVDPYGRTIAALPTLSDDVYTFKVPVQKGVQTWFVSGGWIFGWACVGLSPLIFLMAVAGRSSGQNK